MAGKVAFQRRHSPDHREEQTQQQARRGAAKLNEHVNILDVLNNRVYVAFAANITIGVAAYATLLTARITTLLSRGFLIITFTASGVQLTALGTTLFQILVDGVVTKGCWTTVGAGSAWTASLVIRVPVTRGDHVVLLQWRTSVANDRINSITVVEEHAHLLVQEAS